MAPKMPPILRFVICEICGKRTSNSAKKNRFMANFPLDALRCKQWIKVVGKEDLLYLPIEKLHSFKYVCGNHFIGKDFSKKRNCLKKSAVPSINLKADPLPDEMLIDFPSKIHRELCNDQVSNSQVKAITESCISDEEHFKLEIKREADVTIIHTSDEEQLFDTKSSCDETDNFVQCRICAQEEGKIPIFNNERNPHIPEDIKNFSGVVIKPNDGMSQFMCNDCLELLNECITFRDMCRLTNKSLLDGSTENNKNCSEGGDDDVQDVKQNLEAESENHLKEPEIWKCSHCNKVFLNLGSYETHLKCCFKPAERKNTETMEDAVQVKRKREYSNYREGKIKLSKPTSDTPEVSQNSQKEDLTDSDKDKTLGLYGGNMLKCPHCDHKAPTAVDLLGHVRQVHDSRTPNKCNYCSTNTKNNEDAISLHVTKYQCDVCFKYLQTVHSLRHHKKAVHQNKGRNSKVRYKKMRIETTIDELDCEME